MSKLVPPTAYQGGKQRIAGQILDIIQPDPNVEFYDLCCGSGAVAIEAINRGHDPQKIHMLDAGPWGLLWKSIGSGRFKLEKFAYWVNQIPNDKRDIRDWMQELSKKPAGEDTPYVFLLLQASSFGSKAIWIGPDPEKGFRWMNCSFRRYWTPTATSRRRSHVNPMMPMGETLYGRMEAICDRMRGVTGHYMDIRDFTPGEGVVYVDPPYKDTTHYGNHFDLHKYVVSLKQKCYVSEGQPLSDKSHLISKGRKKGGISGERKTMNQEWLSEFN